MEEKVELNIIALSDSQSQPGQFVLVLETIDQQRRLPIIIGKPEAQAIAVAVEQMKTLRPLTHDAWLQTLIKLGAEIKEVIIDKLEEEIFHAQLVLRNKNKEEFSLDLRSSDAIALAIHSQAAIYTYPSIINRASFAPTLLDQSDKKGSLAYYSVAELEELMQKLIDKEDYQSAARIRDLIQKRKEQE